SLVITANAPHTSGSKWALTANAPHTSGSKWALTANAPHTSREQMGTHRQHSSHLRELGWAPHRAKVRATEPKSNQRSVAAASVDHVIDVIEVGV
ncbi:hypothetical protein GOAMI_31_00010, partial [Gordonia amicalis NBRC 100051 = JCM 11271]